MKRKPDGERTSLEPGELRATFTVSRELADKFRLIAERNDRSFSGEMRRMLREAVEREAEEPWTP